MKITTAAVAVLLASIFVTACEKKDAAPAEAAPVATAPAAESAPPADAAPAEAAPAAAPETNPDAPATGGDKVAPTPQN
jgi:hypothetical protein